MSGEQIEELEIERARLLDLALELTRDRTDVEAEIQAAFGRRALLDADLDEARSPEALDRAAEVLAEHDHRIRRLNTISAELQEDQSDVLEQLEIVASRLARLKETLNDSIDTDRQLDLVRMELTVAPPAHVVAPEDVGELQAELEPLLSRAARYVADESHPIETRDAVEQRSRTLRGELYLHGEVFPDAITITRSAAYLMSVLAEEVASEIVDQVADAADRLGDDDTALAAAEDIGDALQSIVNDDPGDDTAAAALGRGWKNWVEHDLFETHLNRIVSGGLTAAGLVAADLASGGKATAILRAARALVHARFPWIFGG